MIRGRPAAANPSPLLVYHLGPPPSSDQEAEAWINAAGRIAQHHTLFPVRGGEILGRRPRTMGGPGRLRLHPLRRQTSHRSTWTRPSAPIAATLLSSSRPG